MWVQVQYKSNKCLENSFLFFCFIFYLALVDSVVSSCCLLSWCTSSMVVDFVVPLSLGVGRLIWLHICTIKSKVHWSTGESKKTQVSCGTGYKTKTESQIGLVWKMNSVFKHKCTKLVKAETFCWLLETFSWKGEISATKRGNFCIQKGKFLH